MKRSTDAILTTHTGSLPRPDDLVDLLYAAEKRRSVDRGAARTVRGAVADSVRQQVESGHRHRQRRRDEQGLVLHLRERSPDRLREPRACPASAPGGCRGVSALRRVERPAATGRRTDQALRVHGRCATSGTRSSRRHSQPEVRAGRFAGDGSVHDRRLAGRDRLFQPNQFYPTDAATRALADAMREEYEAIVAAGFILQLDCPDLTGLSRSGHRSSCRQTWPCASRRSTTRWRTFPPTDAPAPVLGQLRGAAPAATCR